MELIKKLLWFAFFVFSTLCFVVLFEKGTTNFVPNVQKQATEFTQSVIKTVQEQIHPSKK